MTDPAPATNLRILIVDDEEDIRDILVDYFGLSGHDCLTAENGEVALALCRAQRFDLVVMDYLMPEMSGLELHESLSHERLCDRFIFMSGSVQLPERTPLSDPQVLAWLEKPFPLESFDPLLARVGKEKGKRG